ncbi:MAG: TIGR02281 family clan AA aspartic protease [Gammaproteobacteria bacterium]|nr:TIGR02281 family clan AA aspartic protease [Gammaproteobacteria bacterium]
MNHRLCLSLLLAVLIWPASADVSRISLFALFKDKAIIQVNDARRMLAAGETSPEGVKLISTDTEAEEAVVERSGKRETLKLGVVVLDNSNTSRDKVVLHADERGFFLSDGEINGHYVKFLVDTGANTIALNSETARRLGIDYRKGVAGKARTASGYALIFGITLDKVKVGDILLRNVDAGVIDGPQPETPLLGMSFLKALEMKRDGDRMELIQRY